MPKRLRWINGLLSLLLWWNTSTFLYAMPIDSALQQGQQALAQQENGQLDAAIASYEQVIAQGYGSATLYNNLGLAYAKQGTLGKAIVQWERALRQRPHDQDAQHNLKVAQQYIKRPIVATKPIALVRAWQGLRQQGTALFWGGLFLCLWSLAIVSGGYAWYKTPSNWKTHQASKLALLLLLCSLLPMSLGLSQQAQEQTKDIAVVIAAEAGLRPYPELSSEEMEVLSEGVRMQVVAEEGEWVQVELPNYLIGWVPKSLLERV